MMKLTPNLILEYSDPLEHQIRTTHPGMAHFANTGPFGRTCGECVFLGYYRKYRNSSGDLIKTAHRQGCAKFLQLTRIHGARVPASAAACKYFERKKEETP
jgi:hypothetical protein